MEESDFQRIQEICAPLELTIEQLTKLKNDLTNEIVTTLKAKSNAAIIKCWPTFVQEFPHGCEHGRFLVLNMEETNFRINLYHLRGESEPEVQAEYHEIPEYILPKENDEIFVYISECLQRFLLKRKLHKESLAVVISLPLALKHANLKSAMLTENIKGFHFEELMGQDLGEVIQNAIDQKNSKMELVALMNEATGVLLTGAWRNVDTKIGVVVGEDTNVCYVEKKEEIACLENTLDTPEPSMIIHWDWSEFGEKAHLESLLLELDRQVDSVTPNPGLRLYDKLLSGSNAAEMSRHIFQLCTTEGVLFGGELGRTLQKPFTFTIRHLIEVLAESTNNFENSRLMFDRLGVMKPSDAECSKVRYILESVTKRAAALMAAGLACLLEKIGQPHTVIAIDGSFYRRNEVYHQYLEDFLGQLVSNGLSFELKHTEDGIGRGAALLASISRRQQFLYQSK